jgi:mannose-6-phosphate isomerase-like protein (cupin superfamily)
MIKFSPADGLARLPGPPTPQYPNGARSVALLEHGTLQLRLFHPQERDRQLPHTRDEVYVIVRGQGLFEHAGERAPVQAGDALFVPAHDAHRFVEFSSDFQCWVLFYGPEGGEKE